MFFSALEKASLANSAGFAVDLMPLGITDFSILMTKSKTTKKKRRNKNEERRTKNDERKQEKEERGKKHTSSE